MKKSVIVLNRVLCFYLKKMESMLITAANNVDTTQVAVPKTVKLMYQQDIETCKLELQLHMLNFPDLVKVFKKSKNLTRLTVTKGSTITDMLVAVPLARDTV